MKVAYHTLGCKVNQCDTLNIAQAMAELGFETAEEESAADIIIINTCAVTNESERKSRQLIRKLRQNHPDAIIVVTGCYSETKPEQVISATGADIVCGVKDRMDIPTRIEECLTLRGQSIKNEAQKTCENDAFGRTRAYLKIQDGCKMFCSYCIVPYARQTLACMPCGDIIKNVHALTDAGYREVVLTGIHIASYFSENNRLIDVMEAVVHRTGIARIRLGSLEPKLLSEEFVSRLAVLGDRVCPHFHISLQSGSNKILAAMNRKYTAEDYLAVCERIRRYYKNAAITTDIIVGFPSEDETEFEETAAFVREAGFSHVHIFPYSPKKGTPAAEAPLQVISAVKHDRARRLSRICADVQNSVLSEFIGTSMQVLCEKYENGFCEGFSENYIKVRFPSDTDDRNRIVTVAACSCEDGIITGEKID